MNKCVVKTKESIAMKADWLIVGAGFTGCTLAERITTELGQTVAIVDRRPWVGGNACDWYNEDGILVHRYGPHIFHTNSRKVWDYLSRFTGWRPYEHHVLAVVDGKTIPVPFNLNSIEASFPEVCASQLTERLLAEYGANTSVPVLKLREITDSRIRYISYYVYEKVFYGYTLKQWQLTPEQLDPLVTGRVPIRLNRDNRYFEDVYQAMPLDGYSSLFAKMLKNPGIEVLTNTDYRNVDGMIRFDRMIFTGPIDDFFDNIHGRLPYRSLRFEFKTLDQEWFQRVGTVNFPNTESFTRITEQKHITGQTTPKTTVVEEYPQSYIPGENEPYYPIPREENRERYNLYLREAERLNGSVLFAGRLADYKYYNMDQAVARALRLFEERCVK
jgi:UDP-galactopyranose mutase